MSTQSIRIPIGHGLPGTALTFVASSTDKVATGWTGDADPQVLTFIALVYPTSFANGLGIYEADNGAVAFRALSIRNTGAIRMEVDRATTDLNYTTSTVLMTTGSWQWVAMTFDSARAANALVRIYRGFLDGPLVEESSYASTTDGTGSFVSGVDQARWGNRAAVSSLAFGGSIAIGMAFPIALDTDELNDLIQNPRVYRSMLDFKLFGQNGTGIQENLVGNSMHGTVTGATLAAYAPQVMRSALDIPFTVAAGGAVLSRGLVNAGLVNRGLVNGGGRVN